MTAAIATSSAPQPPISSSSRLDYLDATRAFALLLGILFHASLSFLPVFVGWAVQDVSTSPLIGSFMTVSHSFRLEIFFLLAGFFSFASFHREGLAGFVRSRLMRIVVPFVVGWLVLRPLVVSGWIMGGASLKGDYSFWAGIQGGFQSLKTLPAGIFTGSHLWFLYYLAMITALMLIVRGLAALWGNSRADWVSGADRLMTWLAGSRFSLPILTVPTAGALWFMRTWGMDTPDQTLWPQMSVVAIYGGFFLLGWMLGRQPDQFAALTRPSVSRGLFLIIATTTTLSLSGIQGDPGHPHHQTARACYVISYAFMMWLLVFLTLGVFKSVFRRPNSFMRYLADASYWLYLIHLPIVVWLQVAVAEVPLHWMLKLGFVFASTLVPGLLSYDLIVRSTFLGWTLNGRRRPRLLRAFVLGESIPSRDPKLGFSR